MKKLLKISIVMLIIIIIKPVIIFAQPDTQFIGSTVIEITIPAPSLEDNLILQSNENKIAVYLPPNYENSNKSYPVIYYLPGYGDSHLTYVNIFKTALNELIPAGDAKEMIVVAINGMNTIGGSFYANSPVSGNWEDHITKDVVEYVDTHFRTIKEVESRGLVGHSMGGFGVLNIVEHTKDIFGYAYSMSPGLFGEEGFGNFPLYFGLIKINDFDDLNEEEAKEKYKKDYCRDRGWPNGVTFSYAAAFAYNTDKYPYIDCPEKIETGFEKDETWKRYEAGYGDIENKLSTYKDNLLSLKKLVIEYGKNDEFNFIPSGCKYFKEEADKLNIPCELIEFDGRHQDMLKTRLQENIIVFFTDNWQHINMDEPMDDMQNSSTMPELTTSDNNLITEPITIVESSTVNVTLESEINNGNTSSNEEEISMMHIVLITSALIIIVIVIIRKNTYFKNK